MDGWGWMWMWMEWMDGGGMGWKLWPWIVWCNGPEQHRGFGWFGCGNISYRARFRNSRTPAGFTPKGWPIGLRTRGRFSTFEPAKSKEWMDGGGSGSFGRGSFDVTALSNTVDSATETPPRARFRNSGTPAGFKPKGSRIRSRTRRRTAASKPLNAKQNLYGVDRVCGLATSWQAEVDLAPCTGWLKMRCCHWSWPATVALELAGKQLWN